uniref:Uncharacterized protein n=1 Tax=Ascaris lumbricoides TaxID=6252 RepID=A0A0M3IWA8_ASCLU
MPPKYNRLLPPTLISFFDNVAPSSTVTIVQHPTF